ncbi:flagellar biosynthesis repressor FlbT [Phyllobacterium sp. 21LDTY02-6]|uniref:flagellar biosynthesis repressor FlbT n=1 Tax=Phyllobacterium sp. 21LDTY02-6 TaxID=2944903 RepID=UPI0020224573|nr:flagellar biosynthesis repressor FlbT [Phyllobacterium sp. 21LDTY02-6]MCO4315669.1 flagellar biosynthesis repressor FlbT [Phyllobacterium sp. 21LDTY02-6]
MKISLRAGEKLYVNGAVLRADRKVALEFMNDVSFLLENHVLQPEQTTTPLRQLYFAAQIMLLNPAGKDEAHATFKHMLASLLATFSNKTMLKELKFIDELVFGDRIFEALKSIRSLYPLEAQIMSGEPELAVKSGTDHDVRPEAGL